LRDSACACSVHPGAIVGGHRSLVSGCLVPELEICHRSTHMVAATACILQIWPLFISSRLNQHSIMHDQKSIALCWHPLHKVP
jgi:hypothetical protein